MTGIQNEVVGYINSIETLGTVDDGGIRFVLFMQGCAMRCQFCHNPDTWLSRGKPMTVGQVIEQLMDYKVFFDLSGGGITVSGGEPLLQHEFVRALFERCGELGVHRALDTSGYCRHGELSSLLPYTDLILFSIKVVNSEKHKRLTGVDNRQILDNIRIAASSPVELILRYVLIPGINDSDQDFADLAGLVRSLDRRPPVDILPYSKLGSVKWKQLGLEYLLEEVPEPGPEQLARARHVLERAGLTVVGSHHEPALKQ